MEYDSDLDISWLTQTPSLEKNESNFNIGFKFIEEDIVSDCVVIMKK